MATDTQELVNIILDSYSKYDTTVKIESEHMLNKDLLIEVAEEIRKILFPGFFSEHNIRKEYLNFIIGERLEFIQYNLRKQITRALQAEDARNGAEHDDINNRAEDIVYKFIKSIPKIREYLYTDIQAAYDGDPAASNTDEIIFSYPGLFAITIYRIAHELWILDVPMIPRIMTEYAHSSTGIDIHPGAAIGRYFFIDHGTGTVIGGTTEIGENVKIYQGVTLGAISTRHGQHLHGVKRHPTIGNNVTIYSGTSVLGGNTVIGNDVTIGGNAFIVTSIPDGMKVSIRNPELQYTKGISPDNSEQEDLWYWII